MTNNQPLVLKSACVLVQKYDLGVITPFSQCIMHGREVMSMSVTTIFVFVYRISECGLSGPFPFWQAQS